MNRSRLGRIVVCSALLLVGAVLFSGCLRGKAKVALRFDPQRDEFHLLTVWQNIRGGTASYGAADKDYDARQDLERLKTLLERRNDLIIFEPVRILAGPPALLRLADREYATVSLEHGLDGPPAPTTTPVSLSRVQIRPGTLFLAGTQNLGYYHEVVIPGKTLDEFLQVLRAHPLSDDDMKDIDQELARREAGGQRTSWDELVKQTVESMRRPAGQSRQPASGITAYLRTESLRMLRAALTKNQLDLGRHGSVLYLRLPLTAADAKDFKQAVEKILASAVASADALADRLAAQVQAPEAEKPELRQAMHRCLEGITLRPWAGGVEIAVDLPAVVNLAWYGGGFDLGDKESPQIASDRAAEMARLAEAELPVVKDLTVATIYRDFQAGRLRPHPASQPAPREAPLP